MLYAEEKRARLVVPNVNVNCSGGNISWSIRWLKCRIKMGRWHYMIVRGENIRNVLVKKAQSEHVLPMS